jgi:hypothetical protein
MQKMILSALTILTFTASAAALIAGWRPVDGLSEAQADQMTRAAIADYLTYDEDGEICGVDDVWYLEREKDTRPDRPERGEIFAVTAYAKGPYMGCSGTRSYDCRVVFNRPPNAPAWQVEYTDCEDIGPGDLD